MPLTRAFILSAVLLMTSTAHASDQPLVMAHRGGLGHWPENTILGFHKALEQNVDVLEIDVWRTKDNVVVVNHDRTVDRTTDGSGRVADFTLKELQALDAGYRWSLDGAFPYRGAGHVIPTLDQVFTEFPEARVNIDIKENSDELINGVCQSIEKHNAHDTVIVASFHQSVLPRVRERCPGVVTSAGFWETARFLVLSWFRLTWLYKPPFAAFQVPVKLGFLPVVTPTFVRAAHGLGVEVHPWTINDPEVMRRLIDMGVDGIITDYPDRLWKVLDTEE